MEVVKLFEDSQFRFLCVVRSRQINQSMQPRLSSTFAPSAPRTIIFDEFREPRLRDATTTRRTSPTQSAFEPADNMSDVEVEEVAPSGYTVLPKEVTAEIGSVKLFNKWYA